MKSNLSKIEFTLLALLCALLVSGCGSHPMRAGQRQAITAKPDAAFVRADIEKARKENIATRKANAVTRKRVDTANEAAERAAILAKHVDEAGTTAHSTESKQIVLEVATVRSELLAVQTDLATRNAELETQGEELVQSNAKASALEQQLSAREAEFGDFVKDRNDKAVKLDKSIDDGIKKDAKIAELTGWVWKLGIALAGVLLAIAAYFYFRASTPGLRFFG